MSYILDALRKAERDRNLGRTPSLGDVTAATARAPSRRPSRRTLALIGLVLILLVCTVALWPRGAAPTHPASPPAPVAASQPMPQGPATATPMAVPAAEVSAAAAQPDAALERTLDPEVPADSIDDLLEEPVPPPTVPDEGRPVTAGSSPDEGSAQASAAVADEEPTEPPELEQGEPAVEAPPLRDMPADYRGAFPELRVDVHVYDPDAARRWILVNGHKAVEGTTLGEGPTVSRITPEGIVFDFRGRSVLLPLNR